MSPYLPMLVLAYALTASGCSGFRATDSDSAPPDQGVADLARDQGADSHVDVAPNPPPDEPCPDYWAETDGTGNCAGRRVVEIATDIIENSGISIAVTAESRRIVIAYQRRLWADEATFHLASLGAEPGATISHQQVPSLPMHLMGEAFDLAPSTTGNVVHLAHLDIQDVGGEITHRTIDGETLTLGNPSTLANDVSRRAQVRVFEATNGETFGLYYNDLDGTIYWRRYAAAEEGAWSPALTALHVENLQGVGAGDFSLARQPNGLPALVHTDTLTGGSKPRFAQFHGAGWTSPKTVDGATGDTLAGYAPGLAIVDTRRTVAHFSIAEIFELRIAEWEADSEIPKVSVLTSGVQGDLQYPPHDLAMASDRYGLLHLLVVEPGSDFSLSVPGGSLEYWRQRRAGGTTRWISDTIAINVVHRGERSRVDLQVDGDGKPHIAFYDATSGRVLYMTRDDRD